MLAETAYDRSKRSQWGWTVDKAVRIIEDHPDWSIEISGDHRPQPYAQMRTYQEREELSRLLWEAGPCRAHDAYHGPWCTSE